MMKEQLLELFKKENVRVRDIEFEDNDFFIKIDGELNYIRARRFITLKNWTIDANGFKRDSFYIEGSFTDRSITSGATANTRITDGGVIYKAYLIKILALGNNGYHYSIGAIKFADKIHYSVEEMITEAKERIDGLLLQSSEARKKALAQAKVFTVPTVMTFKEMEREYIRFVLELTNENRLRACRMLQISPRTLRCKIGRYASEGDQFFNRLFLETEHMGPNK